MTDTQQAPRKILNGTSEEPGDAPESSDVFVNPKLKASYERGKRDAAAGRVHRFKSAKDLIKALKSSTKQAP